MQNDDDDDFWRLLAATFILLSTPSSLIFFLDSVNRTSPLKSNRTSQPEGGLM